MHPRSRLRSSLIAGATSIRLDAASRRWSSRRGRRSQRVQVVGLHGTPAETTRDFEAQLEWVGHHFDIIDYHEFAEISEARARSTERTRVLFTFDDGLESNYLLAAPLLEEIGARGVFFVVPEFATSAGDAAHRFFAERIKPNRDVSQWPERWWKPMDPEQIADLAQRGHTIGNHTMSHAWLAGRGRVEQRREITTAQNQLSDWTGQDIDAFAWTFQWNSVDESALQIAAASHRFCFAPCAGTADLGVDSPHLIWRTRIDATYRPREYRFFYSGLANPLYAGRRRWLRSLETRDP